MPRGANLLSCERKAVPSALHSQEGIQELEDAVRYGLRTKYYSIAQSMFRYDGWSDEPLFRDMNLMSRDTMPERWIFDEGEAVLFMFGDQLQILPMVYNTGVNIYGYPDSWHPQPVGWDTNGGDAVISALTSLKLDADNSVVFRNDRFGTADSVYINAKVEQLVDAALTFNQLELLAKCPFIFATSPENILTNKNVYLDIASNKPVIYKSMAGAADPSVLQLANDIDPALFELYDRNECDILEYLGYPCVPITKRAQQSVSEVQSNDDKIQSRRNERLFYRQQAVDRMNAMFGTNVTVVSVIDEQAEKLRQEAQEEQESMYGGDDDDMD